MAIKTAPALSGGCFDCRKSPVSPCSGLRWPQGSLFRGGGHAGKWGASAAMLFVSASVPPPLAGAGAHCAP